MQEALEWAADYAERSKLFDPVRNERGYADKWVPPTPAEKARIIVELARSAMEPHALKVPTEVDGRALSRWADVLNDALATWSASEMRAKEKVTLVRNQIQEWGAL